MLLLLEESIAGCCAGVEEGTDDVALVRPIVRSLDASSMVGDKSLCFVVFASAKKGARRTLSSSGAIAIIFIYSNPGKFLVLWDNDGDGYLSYKENLKFDCDWSSFDYDQDGFLSREELFDNMKCWEQSVDPPAAMMDLYMAVGDRNGDARIGLVEWSFLNLFYVIDWIPKDGSLSKEEFENFLTLTNTSWDFDSFDDDKDGMISLGEWMINAAEMQGVDYNDYS
eukprot:scaffold206546_cov41-Cyclotella_meneghiniana.AAC.1